MIDLEGSISSKEVPENESPKSSQYHWKNKVIKVLTPKQVLQRLAID